MLLRLSVLSQVFWWVILESFVSREIDDLPEVGNFRDPKKPPKKGRQNNNRWMTFGLNFVPIEKRDFIPEHDSNTKVFLRGRVKGRVKI